MAVGPGTSGRADREGAGPSSGQARALREACVCLPPCKSARAAGPGLGSRDVSVTSARSRPWAGLRERRWTWAPGHRGRPAPHPASGRGGVGEGVPGQDFRNQAPCRLEGLAHAVLVLVEDPGGRRLGRVSVVGGAAAAGCDLDWRERALLPLSLVEDHDWAVSDQQSYRSSLVWRRSTFASAEF